MAKIKSSPTRNLLFLALIIFSLIYYFQGKGLDINPFSSEEKKIEQEVEIKVEAKPIMEASQASTFEKLNIYVDVLNRQSRRIIDSYARYLSWCNKETGPTGQERHKYGLYSLYDHTKVGSDFEKAQAISESRLAAKVGTRQEVIVDTVDDDGATCRTKADAPEIDGNLFIDEAFEGLSPGDIVTVAVDEASEYDLWGRIV